ncbi:MAG: nucleotidyltransferase family protein [Candidatus Heimdallarchaeaceae archaeon]
MEKILNLSEVLDLIEQNMDKISSYGIKSIGVFGSFAKNKQCSSSDLDILVEFKEGMKNFENYMGLRFFLEDLFQKKVDLVIKESIKPQLRKYILGSVVYAKRI